MSETAVAPAGAESSAAPGSDPGNAGTPAPTAPPEGFVPQGEMEATREELRRATQAQSDLRKELDRLKDAKTAAAPSNMPADSGFDPDGFKRSLLTEVYGANLMSQTASALKAEFPHADPGLFSPERLSTYGSPEALRFDVQDSHNRVAAILGAEKQRIEAMVREEIAASVGGVAGAPGTPPAPGGDPTPEQVAAMTFDEMNRLEAERPGTLERVQRNALGI